MNNAMFRTIRNSICECAQSDGMRVIIVGIMAYFATRQEVPQTQIFFLGKNIHIFEIVDGDIYDMSFLMALSNIPGLLARRSFLTNIDLKNLFWNSSLSTHE